MLNRRIVAGLAALSAVATVNLLAACTPADDSDVFETPTPGPEPTPAPINKCQVVWTSQNPDGSVAAFVIDGLESDWQIEGNVELYGDPTSVGTGTDGLIAFFFPETTVHNGVIDTSAWDDTTGYSEEGDTFDLDLTVNTTHDGETVGVTAAGPITLLAIDTAGNPTTAVYGSAMTFGFDGVWSPKGTTAPSLDTGATADLEAGGAVTVGDFGSWAICYDIEQH